MRVIASACFFLSGASGLVLEMLWTRMLTLVFGSTTLAISTVLTTFMGGLGLGAYLAGRVADRVRDPVRAYAAAEASIGVYALLVPALIAHYPAVNQWLWTAFGDRYGLLSTFRFCAAAALLIVPTTLMGTTLPLLSRYFVSRPYEIRRVSLRLGTLYAINLFGAVAGAFFGGFVFLPTLGVRATNMLAASFNLTLALAIVVGRFVLRGTGETPPPPTLDELAENAADADKPSAPGVTPTARRLVLAAFVVSGMTAMILQVLWTRALAVLIGSSIFSFTLILVAFLVGLGAGSAAFGRWLDRTTRPVAWLAAVHLGIAFTVGLSYLIGDRLPFVFAWLASTTTFDVDAILFCQFVVACISVLPCTFLMGAVFPLSVRVAAARFDHVGRDVGSAYALNTVGAIAGSFLSGFVVLPQLGLQRGIYLAACGSLLLAALLVAAAPDLRRRQRTLGIALAVGLAGVGLLLPRWNLTSFSSGFFRVSIAKDYIQRRAAKQSWSTPRLVFYEDGIATTVSVDQWGEGFSLKNNGKVDASSEGDMPTQISVGLLPLLLYPNAETHPPKVALVGFGSGVTAGSITQFPIASLEVVELEPAIYRASKFFNHLNHRPLENPLVTARVGDGRNFLSQRTDPFDVIVSQPSNPWITGVSNLFTREYFRAVRGRLAPGGIFCQWAQLYEMAPWNIKAIFRSLREEFRYVFVFAAEDLSSDTVLIATQEPLKLDAGRIARAFENARTRAEAARAGFASPHDIPAFLLLGPDEMEAFTAGAMTNTDDNALIELGAPRDLLGHSRYDAYLARVYGDLWPYGRLTDLVAGYDRDDRAAAMSLLTRSLIAHGKAREAELWMGRAEAAGGGPETRHARLLMDLIATRDDYDPEIPLAPADALTPPLIPADVPAAMAQRLSREYAEVTAEVRLKHYANAFKIIQRWPEKIWDRLGKDFALLSGFLDYKSAFYTDAIASLKPLADDPDYVARRPETLYYLGRAYFSNADYVKSVAALERFAQQQSALGRPLLPGGATAEAARIAREDAMRREK